MTATHAGQVTAPTAHAGLTARARLAAGRCAAAGPVEPDVGGESCGRTDRAR
jgi:hypothetical protein